jgi:hypothetical protein
MAPAWDFVVASNHLICCPSPLVECTRLSEVVPAPIARQEKLHVLSVPVQFRIVVDVYHRRWRVKSVLPIEMLRLARGDLAAQSL